MPAPAHVKEKIAMLRESFMHSAGVQDWIASWWSTLNLDDRRLLLALAGLDESPESARRPWKQHAQDTRDALISECKRVGRIVEALRWA